jgi:NAD(P)-dependent dehydrogenase (short-subunit alcohol dehydrogenase family)
MLNDTVALALGGDAGIGKAIGVQLAKNGSKVALASRLPAHLRFASNNSLKTPPSADKMRSRPSTVPLCIMVSTKNRIFYCQP